MKKFFKSALMLVAAVCAVLASVQCNNGGNSRETVAESIDKYIQDVKAEWNITGMAVCFSLDDELLFEKGYGIKDMNKPADDPDNQITP